MSILLALSIVVAADAPPAQKVLPRCLVMLAEQNIGDQRAKFWWGQSAGFSADFEVAENTLADILKSQGFVVVDRRVLAGKVEVTPAISSSDPSDKDIKEFAVKSGADVVFVGKVIAVDSGTVLGTPMHSLQATLSMRAMNVDDAQIIASTATTQVASHVDPLVGGTKALQKVAQKAGAELAAKVKESWSAPNSKILVTVRGVKDWKRARDIEIALKGLARVQKLTQRAFKDKTAEYEVEYSGSSAALADAVTHGSAAKTVESVTQNTLVLHD
jgi:hypothetical protein